MDVVNYNYLHQTDLKQTLVKASFYKQCLIAAGGEPIVLV